MNNICHKITPSKAPKCYRKRNRIIPFTKKLLIILRSHMMRVNQFLSTRSKVSIDVCNFQF